MNYIDFGAVSVCRQIILLSVFNEKPLLTQFQYLFLVPVVQHAMCDVWHFMYFQGILQVFGNFMYYQGILQVFGDIDEFGVNFLFGSIRHTFNISVRYTFI